MDNLDKLLRINSKLFSSKKGKKILFATGFSGYNHGAIVDKIISTAIAIRNCEPEFFICDKFLPTCMLTKIKQVSPEELVLKDTQPRCEDCFGRGSKYLEYLKFKKHYFSDYLGDKTLKNINEIVDKASFSEIKKINIDGINVGEEAYAGCLRYFGRENLENEKLAPIILKKFLKSALLTKVTFENLLNRHDYDCVVYSHGIYVPHGIINQILKFRNIRSVVYIPSYRKNSFIFSHNDTYHRTMITEKNEKWMDINFDERKKKKIQKYLFRKRYGENDWNFFNKDNEYDYHIITKKNKIDNNKKFVLLLTNVIWDARLHYESNAFNSMIDWIIKTIEFYKKNKSIQLVIRIHPAEITGDVPSRQKVEQEIFAKYEKLPENIIIIKPEDPSSTYTLIEKSSAVLIYNTKTGIEASAMGKKVVVAGEAWVRNKTFSIDVINENDYFKILKKIDLNNDLDQKMKELALKYAYHIFFR